MTNAKCLNFPQASFKICVDVHSICPNKESLGQSALGLRCGLSGGEKRRRPLRKALHFILPKAESD